jgi:hypothetical protein
MVQGGNDVWFLYNCPNTRYHVLFHNPHKEIKCCMCTRVRILGHLDVLGFNVYDLVPE